MAPSLCWVNGIYHSMTSHRTPVVVLSFSANHNAFTWSRVCGRQLGSSCDLAHVMSELAVIRKNDYPLDA